MVVLSLLPIRDDGNSISSLSLSLSLSLVRNQRYPIYADNCGVAILTSAFTYILTFLKAHAPAPAPDPVAVVQVLDRATLPHHRTRTALKSHPSAALVAAAGFQGRHRVGVRGCLDLTVTQA